MVCNGPGPVDSHDARLSIRRRALSFPTLVSLALAAAFLIFLLTRFDLDIGATWSQIQGGNPWLVVAAFLVHYTTFPFRGARWRQLLSNVQHQADDPVAPIPSVVYCSQLLLLGCFANSVGWFHLGDIYRAHLYRLERNGSFSRTMGTLLAERIMDMVLVVALLLAATPFLVSSGNSTWVVVVTGAILAGILIVLFLALLGAQPPTVHFLPQWFTARFHRFRDGTLGSFQRVPLLTILGILGWLAEVLRLYLVGFALGMDLGLPTATFVALASSLLTLTPSPGGVGAVEPGVVGLVVRLTSFSIDAAAALAVVDRFISYLSIILTGALLFLVRQVVHPAKLESPGLGTTDRGYT